MHERICEGHENNNKADRAIAKNTAKREEGKEEIFVKMVLE